MRGLLDCLRDVAEAAQDRGYCSPWGMWECCHLRQGWGWELGDGKAHPQVTARNLWAADGLKERKGNEKKCNLPFCSHTHEDDFRFQVSVVHTHRLWQWTKGLSFKGGQQFYWTPSCVSTWKESCGVLPCLNGGKNILVGTSRDFCKISAVSKVEQQSGLLP